MEMTYSKPYQRLAFTTLQFGRDSSNREVVPSCPFLGRLVSSVRRTARSEGSLMQATPRSTVRVRDGLGASRYRVGASGNARVRAAVPSVDVLEGERGPDGSAALDPRRAGTAIRSVSRRVSPGREWSRSAELGW